VISGARNDAYDNGDVPRGTVADGWIPHAARSEGASAAEEGLVDHAWLHYERVQRVSQVCGQRGVASAHYGQVGPLLFRLAPQGREIRHRRDSGRMEQPQGPRRPRRVPLEPHEHAGDRHAAVRAACIRSNRHSGEAVAVASAIPDSGRIAHGPHTDRSDLPARGSHDDFQRWRRADQGRVVDSNIRPGHASARVRP